MEEVRIPVDLKQAAQEMLTAPTFDKYSLSDVSGCRILGEDEGAKMRSFLSMVGNPYLYRVGDIGVHVVFSGHRGDSLQAHICNLLAAKL